MKIVLILPNQFIAASREIWLRKSKIMAYAPTTLTYLASLVPSELNADISIIDEGVEELKFDHIDADIVGINVITPNAPRAYYIADELRKRNITVVLGGIHATLLPEEAMRHADAIVIGYADNVWPQLLADFSDKRMKKIYKENSISRKIKSNVFCKRELQKNRYILPNTLEASRGCVNNCEFCVIPQLCERLYEKRKIEDIVNEIQTMKSKRFVLLDSNPMADINNFKALMAALIPLKKNWYCSATTECAKDSEWVNLARLSGCRGLLIGFESLNQKSLNRINKNFNQVSEYKKIIKNLHKNRIFVLGSFMLGFDDDNKEIFEKTINFINQTNIDLIHLAINTPFPGTEYFKKLEAEERIITKDWSLYDCTKVVFKPKQMSVEELQEGFIKTYEAIHSYSSIFKRLIFSRQDIFNGLVANIAFRNFGKIVNHETREKYKL